MDTAHFFSETYEESRARFREQLDKVKEHWPNAELETYHIGEESNDNTTDIIKADALEDPKDLIIITTGEHGIEGYAGAAILHLFITEFMPAVKPETTGIRLVHAVNPWGMRNFRRVTENNIDLNRNYVKNWNNVTGRVFNEGYEAEKKLFVPEKPIDNLKKQNAEIYARLTKGLATKGMDGLKKATTSGQYEYPTGIFYGGNEYDEPAKKFMERYLDWVKDYEHSVQIDVHTGGGPADELTLIFMEADKRSEDDLKRDLNYEVVKKTSVEEANGESKQFFQDAIGEKHPDKRAFACLFEFGTFGDSVKNLIRSARAVINENQLYFHGAENKDDEEEIKEEFLQLFYPREEEWRDLVIRKGRAGFEAVLSSENIPLSEEVKKGR